MHGMPSGSNPFLGGERHKMKNVAQNIDPGVVVVVVVLVENRAHLGFHFHTN